MLSIGMRGKRQNSWAENPKLKFSSIANLILYLLYLLMPIVAQGQEPATAEPEIRICSQNLHDYAISSDKSRRKTILKKDAALIGRFIEARCDVIGVQEVMGRSEREANVNLSHLARILSKTSGRSFGAYVAESTFVSMRNGFVIATDIGDVKSVKSYTHFNLPKLQPLGKTRRFIRSPLFLVLEVRPRTKSPARTLALMTFHLKSKVDGWKDPTQTQFETTRMEMAQGINDIVNEELGALGNSVTTLLLGDRNSEPNSAAADILEGKLQLADFLDEHHCALSQDLSAMCQAEPHRDLRFLGLFRPGLRRFEDSSNGSYRFKGQQVYLDDILIQTKDSWMVGGPSGPVDTGLVGTFGQGSDHKLLWAALNW